MPRAPTPLRLRLAAAAAGALLAVLLGGLLPPAAGAAPVVTLRGTYQLLVADRTGPPGAGGHRAVPQLRTGTRTWSLRLPAGLRLRSGTGVAVTGTVSGTTVTVSRAVAAPEQNAPAVTTAGVSTSVLVILAEWNGADAMTPALARDRAFSAGAQWFDTVSGGAVTQHGDVTPWVHVPAPSGQLCFGGSRTILDEAGAAARRIGRDPADYDRTIVYFPYQSSAASGCAGIAGWAEQPGTAVWLNGYLDLPTLTHEQGHNYGLSHAHSYTCDAGALTGSCAFAEYGDPYDAMGPYRTAASYSAKQRSQLGWLQATTLTPGETRVLAPLEGAAGTRAAVVHAAAGRDYWLEYRQRLAPDTALPAGATNGVLVHVVDNALSPAPHDPADAVGPALLDLSPADHSLGDATLHAGSSWRTPEGYRITVGTVGAAGAQVSVGSGAPPPADFTGDGRSDPAVWRPSDGTWWVRGTPSVAYGQAGDVPVPADYDGDGRADLAVWRPATGQWWIRGRAATTWGVRGDVPVPADYTGTGRATLAVWRPATGQWWIAGRAATVYGVAGDVPAPGDYAGAGRAVPAVWRPPADGQPGRWYVLGAPSSVAGAGGDVPVPGDYAGDPGTDRALWSPASGVWSVAGATVATWGRAGDIPLAAAPAVRLATPHR